MADFAYTVETDKSFAQTVRAVEEGTAAAGFRVLHIHDVAETLAEKGFQRDPFKIVEICNAGYAHRILSLDPMVGLFMPCKVNVYVKDGRTVLEALLPSRIARFFPGKEIEDIANEVDKIVRRIVDEAR